MRTIIISVLIVLITACNKGLNIRNLESLVIRKQTQLEIVANEFLIQTEIEYIHLASDSLCCQSINGWIYCPDDSVWKSGKDSTVLYTLHDVLIHDKINFRTFNYFHDFLLANGLYSISHGFFPCNNCVEFESVLNGIRYYKYFPNDLKQDDEYLYVNRINKHWFAYRRDWN